MSAPANVSPWVHATASIVSVLLISAVLGTVGFVVSGAAWLRWCCAVFLVIGGSCLYAEGARPDRSGSLEYNSSVIQIGALLILIVAAGAHLMAPWVQP